jgi:predicted permease
MNIGAWIRSAGARLLRPLRTNDEFREEMLAHLSHRAEDLERTGMSRAEAERQARIEFGGVEKFRQQSQEAMGGNLAESLLHDVRFSLRSLRKSPGFALTAIATLALAIGANAVAFSMLNGVLIRPLNVPRAESLYALQRGDETYAVQSYPDYLDLRDRNRSFESLAAYSINQAALSEGGNPSSPWFYEVSGNYFDALGIRPYRGRFFHAADEHGANSAPYIVLTWAYWHSHFHGDAEIAGRMVQLDKHPFTILGVAPRQFSGTLLFFTPDFFVPMVDQPEIAGWNGLHERGNRWVFEVLGHLKPGVTPTQAGADLDSIGEWMHQNFPKDDGPKSFTLTRPALGGNFFAPAVRAFLTGLVLLAGLILLAACANLGSLFTARAADRGRDIALRLALGSSRKRILRQVFTEALLLSVGGGLVGLVGSFMLLHRLSGWNPFPQFPIRIPVNPDGHVYAVALLLALVSGCLFGAVPIRQILRMSPYEVVKAGSTGSGGGRRGRVTAREVLLVMQITICAVLVTGSIVAVRGMVRALHSNVGFEPRNAMLANTDLSMAGYAHDAIPGMQKRMLDAVREIPGVQAAGLVGPFQPLTMGGSTSSVFRDTATNLTPANAVDTPYQYEIAPGYFRAAGTTLLAGRTISLHDDKNAPRVAVINQQLARELFGSDRAVVGRHFKLQDGTRVEVVGIAEEGKYFSLTEAPGAALFLPILQSPTSQTWLVVRSPRDPRQVAMEIRRKLRGLDPGLPVFIQPWATEMDGALFPARVAMVSLGILGLIGAMLSFTGIFGMAAYSVSRRLRELGIRMALGAQRTEVLRAALGRAFRLLVFGSTAGMLLGVLAAQVLGHIVYQASPRDPLVMGGVVLVMLLLGLAATWIPAQRALSIDPLVLLREE